MRDNGSLDYLPRHCELAAVLAPAQQAIDEAAVRGLDDGRLGALRRRLRHAAAASRHDVGTATQEAGRVIALARLPA